MTRNKQTRIPIEHKCIHDLFLHYVNFRTVELLIWIIVIILLGYHTCGKCGYTKRGYTKENYYRKSRITEYPENLVWQYISPTHETYLQMNISQAIS